MAGAMRSAMASHRFYVSFVLPHTFVCEEGDFAGAGLSGDQDIGGDGSVEVAFRLQGLAETSGVILCGTAGIVNVLVVAHVDRVLHIDVCAPD